MRAPSRPKPGYTVAARNPECSVGRGGAITTSSMRSPPRPARRPRFSPSSLHPPAAGSGGKFVTLTRQGGAGVEYIGRATIRPGTDRAAFDVQFGTCLATPQPRATRACRPAGRFSDDAFVVSDARAWLAAHLADAECSAGAGTGCIP